MEKLSILGFREKKKPWWQEAKESTINFGKGAYEYGKDKIPEAKELGEDVLHKAKDLGSRAIAYGGEKSLVGLGFLGLRRPAANYYRGRKGLAPIGKELSYISHGMAEATKETTRVAVKAKSARSKSSAQKAKKLV